MTLFWSVVVVGGSTVVDPVVVGDTVVVVGSTEVDPVLVVATKTKYMVILDILGHDFPYLDYFILV